MSQRFLEHARIEADKGDDLQVSEKAWGAMGARAQGNRGATGLEPPEAPAHHRNRQSPGPGV